MIIVVRIAELRSGATHQSNVIDSNNHVTGKSAAARPLAVGAVAGITAIGLTGVSVYQCLAVTAEFVHNGLRIIICKHSIS
jgi:hypothetical protein